MKRFVVALALAVALGGTALYAGGGGGGFGGGGPGGGMGGFGGGMGMMGRGGGANPMPSIQANVTDLSADQTTKLTAISDDLNTKMTAWQESSQAVLQPLQPQMGTPATPAETDKLNAETFKQNGLRDDMVNDAEIKMVAILTPAQADKFETARLNQQVNTRLGQLGLTADQKSKITAATAEASKAIAGAKDKAALVKAKGAFWAKVAGLCNEYQITQVFTGAAGGRGGFGGFGGMGGMGGFGGGMGGPPGGGMGGPPGGGMGGPPGGGAPGGGAPGGRGRGN
jgi:hypothetical protein